MVYLSVMINQPKYMLLEVKIFMWLLRRKIMLNKDQLVKRGWSGSKKCILCDGKETEDHFLLMSLYILRYGAELLIIILLFL
jgi:zinc-binding in reverse transcriptase